EPLRAAENPTYALDRTRGGTQRTARAAGARIRLIDCGRSVRGGRREPRVVEVPEIAIAVGGASVARAAEVGKRCRVRRVRRVVVEGRGRPVLNKDVLGAARRVRVVADSRDLTQWVPVESGPAITLELTRSVVDLVEEAVVQAVTSRGVWAPV